MKVTMKSQLRIKSLDCLKQLEIMVNRLILRTFNNLTKRLDLKSSEKKLRRLKMQMTQR